ncbi:hypothetical protein ATO6_09705 [Oceanicola sp. 22II-s10i]|uniref:PRC-barrel domain-containing protein n=1 Tax=Oceanicola sp. 22II-s10i TaxID=1317116 RepID=UPI000B52527E|nr:PRC-barrel domain-containing protein [Oceanicola sp. 22II-s10i]OWU85282.1 hypothetical protein ATO6_09705 [Oceanicola sp. 22II-s10i]
MTERAYLAGLLAILIAIPTGSPAAKAQADVSHSTVSAETTEDGAALASVSQEATLTVGDLIGATVNSTAGDNIGVVDDVVQMRGEVLAIIGVGGFFGFGSRDVAVPLTELALRDDRLTAPGYTEVQLESMRDFDAGQSERLDRETAIRLGQS